MSTTLFDLQWHEKGAALPESIEREEDGSKNRQHDIQDFGEVIRYLVTKTNQFDHKPDPVRYSAEVLNFMDRALSNTANDLLLVIIANFLDFGLTRSSTNCYATGLGTTLFGSLSTP